MLAVKAYVRNGLLGCVMIITLVAGPCRASSASDYHEFMINIVDSYQKSSFSGEFVTTRDQALARFRISRWVRDGRTFERLEKVAADDVYTVLRLDQQIINLYPGKTLSRMQVGRPISPLEQLQSRLKDISSLYQVSIVPSTDERVATRPVKAVRFAPLDKHRFAYTLWVDSSTYLPLKFEYTSEGAVLETTEFVEWTDKPSLNSTFFEVPPGLAEVSAPDALLKMVPSWQAAWLPPGFRSLGGLSDHSSIQSKVEPSGPRRTYGDGIATISVFIQPMMPNQPMSEGAMFRSGALSMVSLPRELAGKMWQVTALGEVPPLTLKMISSHVEFVDMP